MIDRNDYFAFHNVMNEQYPRDISKKVKAVYKMNSEKGLWIGGNAPYGYRKSPTNNKVLVPDSETAPIVEMIFEDFAKGISGREIAAQLTKVGVLSPGDYLLQINGKTIKYSEWGSATICSIIDNEVYIGNMVQGKRKKLSFKHKIRKKMPKENWVRVENTHEAIINKELFAEVQKRRATKTITRKQIAKHEESIFCGQIRCSNCGAQMGSAYNNQQKKMYYRCGTYNNKGKDVCPPHYIREEILEAIVLNDIRQYAQFDKNTLVREVLKLLKSKQALSNSSTKQQLERAEKKITDINSNIKSLWLDKTKGVLPENIFTSMLSDFQKELETLDKQVKELNEKFRLEIKEQSDVSKWAELVEKYADMNKLTRPIAHELIDSIIVSYFYKKDGKNTLDVTINYKFVGNLNQAERIDTVA